MQTVSKPAAAAWRVYVPVVVAPLDRVVRDWDGGALPPLPAAEPAAPRRPWWRRRGTWETALLLGLAIVSLLGSPCLGQ